MQKNKLNFVYFRIFSPFGVLDKKNKIIEEFLVSKKIFLKLIILMFKEILHILKILQNVMKKLLIYFL